MELGCNEHNGLNVHVLAYVIQNRKSLIYLWGGSVAYPSWSHPCRVCTLRPPPAQSLMAVTLALSSTSLMCQTASLRDCLPFSKKKFIYFWWCWVLRSCTGFSIVVEIRDHSSLWCRDCSLQWLLLWQSTGSRHLGFSSYNSQALECRLSSYRTRLRCSGACGIFPHQGSNRCPLHCRVDS